MNRYNMSALLVSVLAPTLIIFLLSLSNRNKYERYKQWFYPMLAAVYAVLCCLEISNIDKLVQKILDQPYMAQIRQFIMNGNNLSYGKKLYLAVLTNILILLAFLILKNGSMLIVRVFSSIFGIDLKGLLNAGKHRLDVVKTKGRSDQDANSGIRGQLFRDLVNVFYHIDDNTGRIRAEWFAFREMSQYAGIILFLLCIGLTVFLQIPAFGNHSWFSAAKAEQWIDILYIWPAISAVVILEFIFFLGGKDQIDLPSRQKSEEIQTKSFVDYSPLIGEYENLFPERYAGVLKVPNFPITWEKFQPETEFEKALYNRLQNWEKQSNKKIEKSVLETITSLPDRRNTLIDASLSDIFGECLMIYFNILLARGENILVLCRDEDSCVRMREYFEETLRHINGLSPVWIVHSVNEAYAEGDCDVLIVTPEVILDPPVAHAQSRFFSRLSTVLLIDAARLASEISALMMAVSEQISSGRKNDIQYIGLCNSIPPELQNTLELIISPGRDFRTFECFSSDESSHIMLWNYEPAGEGNIRRAQKNIFRAGMDHVYLGVAVPLACVGIKYKVPKVSIMGTRVPSRQLQDALRLGNSMMGQYFSDNMSTVDVPDRIEYQNITTEDPFVVVMDESYNLSQTIRNYSRYIGSSCAMIHVISKPYMFRDFFASHAGEYLLDKTKMDMFSVPLGDPLKNAAVRLFFEAGNLNGLSEDRLMETMQVPSFREALERCYSIVRNGEPVQSIEPYFAIATRTSFNRKTNEYEHKRWITLKQPGIELLNELKGNVKPARIRIGENEISLGIPRCNIYQYYLPDQAVVVRNSMYYINDIDSLKGILIAGSRIDQLDVSIDYVQHREYTLEMSDMRSERKVLSEMSMGNAKIKRAESYEVELLRNVKITVDTLGQIVPDPAFPVLDLTNRSRYRELSHAVQDKARRVHEKGSVIAVRFNKIDPEQADRTAVTLAVLLNELMKTLFPYNWQCIAVCPVLHGEIRNEGSGISFQNLAIAYPQLKTTDKRYVKPDTAEVLIIEDSAGDSGVLDALFRNRQDPLNNVFSVLREYLKWQRSFERKNGIRISADYLRFGAEQIPSYFNLSFLEDLLCQLKTVNPINMQPDDEISYSDHCYFCHKDLRISDHILIFDENGKKNRKICSECAKQLVSEQKDLTALYQATVDYLSGIYGICFRDKIRIRFVSAETIARQRKGKMLKYRHADLLDSITNTIAVERNTPKEYVLRRLVRELTHIWQYEYLKCDDLSAREGHSSYVEAWYMHDLGLNAAAEGIDAEMRNRQSDPEGKGYVWMYETIKGRADGNPFAFMLEQYGKKGVTAAKSG